MSDGALFSDDSDLCFVRCVMCSGVSGLGYRVCVCVCFVTGFVLCDVSYRGFIM